MKTQPNEKNLSVSSREDHIHVVFHNDLDMEIMLQLKPEIDRLIPQITKPIIVDLEAVEFLDSSAVGVLALFFRHAQLKKLVFVIACAQPQPEAVLGMVGLSDHVMLYQSLGEAVSAVQASLKA